MLQGGCDLLDPLLAWADGDVCGVCVDVDSLYLMFVLWRLLFAGLHVKAQLVIKMSKSLKSTCGVSLGLDAAIIIDKVDYWSCCEHS